MDNNILRQAEHSLNVNEVKRATIEIKEFIPSIVEMNKSVYDEMLKQGFNEQQAFKFSCEYTLKTIFQGK
ncbi:hypothetical protein DP122_00250 [Clostridium tetani]|uniref:hypothetical protein n=1 Tax=Clostridium tetani TaxID=1513 RepID=UPI00100B698A|nr:hypothetical protein [Clostridium tetani]RXI57248.1 hypothetical protein DP122_00250 [Clostridium tetani]RXM75118.1 hypothetical protein DP154_10115 [Clostridium tetani]RYU98504.1 hypothetical protein DP144_10810 [Clostridium tetani]